MVGSGKTAAGRWSALLRKEIRGGMEREARISAKVEHAREVERILQLLGWSVAVLGLAGVIVFAVLWLLGSISAEQGLSLILGTSLATVLSGATAYGSGVNVGLGAERLELAARAAAPRAADRP
jgi:uncharacterized membrane protein YbhN (UPF0104 family)